MNSRSSNIERFVQASDGKRIAWDPNTKMITLGETNGRTIATCYKIDSRGIRSKVRNGLWIGT